MQVTAGLADRWVIHASVFAGFLVLPGLFLEQSPGGVFQLLPLLALTDRPIARTFIGKREERFFRIIPSQHSFSLDYTCFQGVFYPSPTGGA